MPEKNIIHVAVGAIVNSKNEVLISLRHPKSHQGGLWEFPGGKIEPGESVQEALRRELLEELGIEVHPAHRLIEVRHDYPDKSVSLDVWIIREFRGAPSGNEGQAIRWLSISDLTPAEFPMANVPIIEALRQLER